MNRYILFSLLTLFCHISGLLPAQEKITSHPNTSIEQPYQSSQEKNTPPNPFSTIDLEEQKGGGGDDRFLLEFGKMLIMLSFIVGLIFFFTWVLKRLMHSRLQQTNTSSQIKIIEQRTLTAKTNLFLLDIKGTGVVIAESMNGVTQLGNFPLTEIDQENNSFDTILKNKMDKTH